MNNPNFKSELEFLKQQLELEQANYKTALELRVNIVILKAMRDKMKLLKDTIEFTSQQIGSKDNS
jgi:hypothetical protein